jgi:hypothetical protein
LLSAAGSLLFLPDSRFGSLAGRCGRIAAVAAFLGRQTLPVLHCGIRNAPYLPQRQKMIPKTTREVNENSIRINSCGDRGCYLNVLSLKYSRPLSGLGSSLADLSSSSRYRFVYVIVSLLFCLRYRLVYVLSGF